MLTREEHLSWCKERAREYLDRGDPVNAVASMARDVTKHPETRDLQACIVAVSMFSIGSIEDAREVIDGCN